MSLHPNDIKSEIRNFKLNSILSKKEFQFEVNYNKLKWGNKRFKLFKEDWWSVINKWRGKSIITGSLCLYVHGLINRRPNDIDLIVDEGLFMTQIESIGKKIFHNNYPGMENKLDVLGYYTQDDFNVDFFKLENQTYTEKDGFLIQDPLEVLIKKSEIYQVTKKSKDRKDLFDSLEFLYELEKKINK